MIVDSRISVWEPFCKVFFRTILSKLVEHVSASKMAASQMPFAVKYYSVRVSDVIIPQKPCEAAHALYKYFAGKSFDIYRVLSNYTFKYIGIH